MFQSINDLIRKPIEVYLSYKKYRQLVNKYGDLEVKLIGIDEIRKRLLELNLEFEKLKVSREEMIENAKRNYNYSESLEKWKNTEKQPLEKKLSYHKKELEMLKSSAFNIAISSFMESNKRVQKIPFIYYDLNSRELIYTASALKFLGIESGPEKLSMNDILYYLKRENSQEVISSLKNNRKLRNYKSLTIDGKELNLSIYPFKYHDRVLGVGISLYGLGIKDSLTGIQLIRKLKKATDAVIYRLDEVGFKARELVDKGLLADRGFGLDYNI